MGMTHISCVNTNYHRVKERTSDALEKKLYMLLDISSRNQLRSSKREVPAGDGEKANEFTTFSK